MDYHVVYNKIVQRAQDREIDPEFRYEQHHIVPRSLGGSDNADNLVMLTPREHYLCHALLVKMNTGQARHKMLYAFNAMRMSNEYQDRITSRLYEYFKHELYEVYSKQMLENNPMHDPEHKAAHAEAMKRRINVGMTGRKHSEETRRKMREARAKQVITDDAKRKISEHMKKKTSRSDYVNPMDKPGVREKQLEAVKNKTYPFQFITPWGIFDSSSRAEVAAKQAGVDIPFHYIGKLCKNSNRTINKISIARSCFLTDEHLGMTPKDLGFDFRKEK
jgi:hypothetical protein